MPTEPTHARTAAQILPLGRDGGKTRDEAVTPLAGWRGHEDLPDGLKPAFHEDPAKRAQWKAFVEDVAVQPGSLGEVCEALARFIMPAAALARDL